MLKKIEIFAFIQVLYRKGPAQLPLPTAVEKWQVWYLKKPLKFMPNTMGCYVTWERNPLPKQEFTKITFFSCFNSSPCWDGLVGIQILKWLLLFGWDIISSYFKSFLWEKKHKISTRQQEMLNSQGCLYLWVSAHVFLPPLLKNPTGKPRTSLKSEEQYFY